MCDIESTGTRYQFLVRQIVFECVPSLNKRNNDMPNSTCSDDSSEDDILLFSPFSRESQSLKNLSRKVTNSQGSDEHAERNRDKRNFQNPSIGQNRDAQNKEVTGDIAQVLGEK